MPTDPNSLRDYYRQQAQTPQALSRDASQFGALDPSGQARWMQANPGLIGPMERQGTITPGMVNNLLGGSLYQSQTGQPLTPGAGIPAAGGTGQRPAGMDSWKSPPPGGIQALLRNPQFMQMLMQRMGGGAMGQKSGGMPGGGAPQVQGRPTSAGPSGMMTKAAPAGGGGSPLGGGAQAGGGIGGLPPQLMQALMQMFQPGAQGLGAFGTQGAPQMPRGPVQAPMQH